MQEKEIIFFKDKTGKIPFQQWYLKLDKSVQGKINVRLRRAKLGLFGDYKSLSSNICELKFKSGIRIYFSEVDGKILLLLLGGNKTRQSDDIKKAQEYLNDYKLRSKDHE
jgi:putative addiction module killer protein